MASIPSSSSPSIRSFLIKPISQNLILSPFSVSFPLYNSRLCAIKVGSVRSSDDIPSYGAEFLRKPVVMPAVEKQPEKEYSGEEDEGYGDTWEDWEDKILEDTVPLVGYVRMILHSGKYESGDKLIPEHEKTILERLLPHHPECEEKIGCGIDYITIGYHPNFESSRCLFIVRKDGNLVDFSFWKCIRGLIRKNYPLYADGFILKHFRKRRHNN